MTLRQYEAILPSKRLAHQKYIFMSNEPAAMYRLASHYNGYFNYTFTYKLDSDITWRFFVVRNKKGDIVAPKVDVKWIDVNDMEPISDDIKRKLQTKNKAAAWHVSHCHTPSRREEFVEKLIPELSRYNLNIDITGFCGDRYCQLWGEECHVAIETDYYFYLAFENSMCDDYVTEKILTATQHYSIPIVFGGANYSRFDFPYWYN
ncbi:alpha-(1,3)-fucosyltransferase C-like [Hyposmocoma kahamanoa]|uniref:alpha-(1,3)-fucosyltransferase C-like n=1 Tax=Hyposmocoma kahamanoa TaxID=1477025 RepID=UPI000E6D5EB9|nr:alpha-(1,3)-fucosyltransferase C-like [Hyposmocoma kahamanoa]